MNLVHFHLPSVLALQKTAYYFLSLDYYNYWSEEGHFGTTITNITLVHPHTIAYTKPTINKATTLPPSNA